MKRVERAIYNAERLLPGIPAPEGKIDPRWQAIVKIGEYIETNPEEVWLFIRKWATNSNEDIRSAIATCLLEHLLEHHFNEYFLKVRKSCLQSKRFASTFCLCSQFGQANQPKNSKAFVDLQKSLT